MQVLFLSQGYAFFLQLPGLKGCLSTLPTRLGQAYHFSQTPSSTPHPQHTHRNTHKSITQGHQPPDFPPQAAQHRRGGI